MYSVHRGLEYTKVTTNNIFTTIKLGVEYTTVTANYINLGIGYINL